MKYIEQREFYRSTNDHSSHNDDTIPIPMLTSAPSTVLDSLKSTRKPESVLEPVLHGRSVAMDNFSELVKVMLESAMQRDRAKVRKKQRKESDDSQCSSASISTSDSELSPASTAQFSPISSTTSQSRSSPHSPTTLSAMQLNSSDGASCVPRTVCATEPSSAQNHLSSVQQESISPNSMEQNGIPASPLVSGSSIDSSPTSSNMMVTPHRQEFIPTSPEQFLNFTNPVEMCSPYNSASNSPPSSYSIDMDTMLHTSPSTDSIPSATSVPFQNPNFIPQPHLNDFNPQIPASFDFSSTTTSPYQPPTAHSSLFNSTSAVSVPTTQAFDSSNLLNSSDPLMHQLGAVGEMMDESNPSIMACLQDATASVGSMFSQSCPQNNFIPNTSAHLNSDFASNILVDSQTSSLSTFTCSSNPEVQDILQQFM